MVERGAVDDDRHGMALAERRDSADGVAGAAFGLGDAGQLGLLRSARGGQGLEVELTETGTSAVTGCPSTWIIRVLNTWSELTPSLSAASEP